MHPFYPMLFQSAFNHCYRATIWFPPLFDVPFHFPRLPWGRREDWRGKYLSILNQPMITQVVNVYEWGSVSFSSKAIFNEATGLSFCCWLSHFDFHYYLINISDIHSFTDCSSATTPNYFCCLYRQIFNWLSLIVGDRRMPSVLYYKILNLYRKNVCCCYWLLVRCIRRDYRFDWLADR